jgi:hypothetical protein
VIEVLPFNRQRKDERAHALRFMAPTKLGLRQAVIESEPRADDLVGPDADLGLLVLAPVPPLAMPPPVRAFGLEVSNIRGWKFTSAGPATHRACRTVIVPPDVFFTTTRTFFL